MVCLNTSSVRKKHCTAPFLVNDDDSIRELSVKVFITIFKRLGDATYTQNILDSSFLQKLHVLMQDKNSDINKKEIENLIKSVKFMLNSAPELKIEEKIIQIRG